MEPLSLEASGLMALAKGARLTPVKNAVLRLLMIGFGRFYPDLVRRMLQKVLVTGKTDAPFAFARRFERTDTGWVVSDRLTSKTGWADVGEIGISGHQTSITTIMARVYQADQLTPFIDLGEKLKGLDASQPVLFERRLEAACAS